MRLTNVSQMQVRPGRLFSYAVSAQRADEDHALHLPVSFDQNRHVGFGSRPGSWMAVSFTLPQPVEKALIAEAWNHVITRHGTLRSVFSWNERTQPTELELTEITLSPGEWVDLGDHDQPEELRTALRAHFDQVCDPFAAPSHRLCVIEEEPGGGRCAHIVIGSDHSHVDAWSLLVLVRDVAACTANLSAGRHVAEGLPEAASFADHTLALQRRPDAPVATVARWRDILDAGGGSMPRFPLDLGDVSQPVPEVVEVRDVFDAEELEQVEGFAAERGVRLIAVAVAVMTRLSAELVGQPLRAVFPVHSRDERQWFDSVGWFITNSVIENDDADYAVAYRAVKEAIRLGSYPLEPIMRPYGGMPQDPGMFAMSWLDHRKLPVNVSEDLQPQHVSSVIRTDGVMIWFVVNGSGMHLRCRYPDTRQARRSMRTWLAGLVYGLRAPLELPE